MPSLKRPVEVLPRADDDHVVAKIQRAESADFSGAVKKRLSGASRTGQACDRCKVRKIRCDARPGGCSPCAQNNAECKTTDRITGRATSRGHVESLENDNDALRQQIADLRRQLQEHGIKPQSTTRPRKKRTSVSLVIATPSAGDDSNSVGSDTIPSPSSASLPRPYDPHSLANILNPAPDHTKRTNSSGLPEYNPDSVGDNYLGVSSSNEWPCPASGTLHSLFGMQLDLKDFTCSEDEEFAQPTTYESFFRFAYDERRTEPPPLPPYQQTRMMCEFWFKLGGPWLPILHKPHFLAMVYKVYHDPDFKMSDPESVQFHCLIAMLLYQVNIRTRAVSQYKWSDHYRYAVGAWPILMRHSDLSSIQAMAMVMCALRNFQRPGAYWVISSKVLTKVVEAGYHRSVSAWRTDNMTLTKHDIEMRKRIFWSVLQCHASLAVRLGRPMLVRLDDFDVELPELINDNLPEEEDLPEHRKCSFLPAVTFFKLLIIQLQMYGQLLTIRPPRQNYEQLQRRLEKQLQFWLSSIPSHLTGAGQIHTEDKAFKLYLEFGYQGARMLLHHPAFLRTPDEALMKNNLDACLDASSSLLNIAKELKALKMLDATWHNSTYYLNAIFTALFAHSYRKDHLTAADIRTLKKDMESWLEVMADIGSLLGSGKRLPLALRQIMSTVIVDVTKYLAAKSSTSSIPNEIPPVPTQSASQQASLPAVKVEDTTATNMMASFNAAFAEGATANGEVSQTVPFNSSSRHLQSSQPSYPSADTFSYPDPSAQMASFSESMYADPYSDALKTDISALAHSALATQAVSPHPQSQPQHSNPDYASQQNGFYFSAGSYVPQQPSSSAWRAFADNMSSTMQHPEVYQADLQQQQQAHQQQQQQHAHHWPATALMSLQTGHTQTPDLKSPSPASAGNGQVSPTTSRGQAMGMFTYDGMPQGLLRWPLMSSSGQMSNGGEGM